MPSCCMYSFPVLVFRKEGRIRLYRFLIIAFSYSLQYNHRDIEPKLTDLYNLSFVSLRVEDAEIISTFIL